MLDLYGPIQKYEQIEETYGISINRAPLAGMTSSSVEDDGIQRHDQPVPLSWTLAATTTTTTTSGGCQGDTHTHTSCSNGNLLFSSLYLVDKLSLDCSISTLCNKQVSSCCLHCACVLECIVHVRTSITCCCRAGYHKLKYRVFKDLWTQGYYITSGLKFGGDFLIYKQHPSHTHASYIAMVTPWQQPLNDRIGSLCRVSTQVGKQVILCSAMKDSGKLVYLTLDWNKL